MLYVIWLQLFRTADFIFAVIALAEVLKKALEET